VEQYIKAALFGQLACHVTAKSQILPEVNKVLLAYLILTKCTDFEQH